jgi:hypothetical protein
MTIATRLANMKAYREEALKHPRLNKLYIEDLDLSIDMFEKALANSAIILRKGFVDKEEIGV